MNDTKLPHGLNINAMIPVLASDSPTRAYLHNAGIKEAYGEKNPHLEAAMYLSNVFKTHEKRLEGPDYFIAILWGDDDEKIVDLAGASPKPWRDNPLYSGAVFVDNVFLEKGDTIEENPITCGDGEIVFGAEEICRRGTEDLDDYMRQSPVLTIPKITRI